MFTGQTLVIVGTIDVDMAIDILAKVFTDFGKNGFIAYLSHSGVGEVCVHAGTVPVQVFTQWFWLVVNSQAIAFGRALQQVTGHPDFVAGLPGAFGEHLKFPLPRRNLGVDAFQIDTGFDTQVQVIFDALPAVGIAGTNRTVIRTLWAGISTGWEAWGQISLQIPEKIFLLEAKPEIFIIVIDGGTARVDGYIRHRTEREEQVLAALASGVESVDEIVTYVYPRNLRRNLRSAAARNVRTHLAKLAEEGRVTESAATYTVPKG